MDDRTISLKAAIDGKISVELANGVEIYSEDVVPVEYLKALPPAQRELFGNSEQLVVPHRNYKYLSDYWCKCGWHLGKRGYVNYCANCGRKVIWDG